MPTQYTTVLRLRMLPKDYATVKAKAEAYRQPLSAFARNAICGIATRFLQPSLLRASPETPESCFALRLSQESLSNRNMAVILACYR